MVQYTKKGLQKQRKVEMEKVTGSKVFHKSRLYSFADNNDTISRVLQAIHNNCQPHAPFFHIAASLPSSRATCLVFSCFAVLLVVSVVGGICHK